MEYLLDIHTLIWLIEGDGQLSSNAAKTIKNVENRVWISLISIWEITIKRSIGKLNLSISTKEILEELEKIEISLMNLDPKAILDVETLPLHHRDPFDRLLICQALRANYIIIGKDKQFKQYGVEMLW